MVGKPHELKCPFCGTSYGWPRETGHCANGIVWTDGLVSLECPCGATYAKWTAHNTAGLRKCADSEE